MSCDKFSFDMVINFNFSTVNELAEKISVLIEYEQMSLNNNHGEAKSKNILNPT